MAETKQTRLTYEDLVLLPEDGRRHELIDGAHRVTASPSTAHQRALQALHWEIESFLRRSPVGEVFIAPLDVVLSPSNVVEPDLFYISRDRSHLVTPLHVRGVPDLVVEVLSSSTCSRDRGSKCELYERFAVGEYWIVDPDSETAEVRRTLPSGFGPPRVLSKAGSEPLETPLLPGWSLPLGRVFRG